jgi:ATP-dependent RNA helicase DeaD
MTTFNDLGLDENIIKAIGDMGFKIPSEVQEKTIPILLNRETDLVSLAQTGTGKTAAFGFPMLQKIDISSRTTQGLILSPTRELCLQITNELINYGKYYKGLNVVAIYGGASITEQAGKIKRGAQIIVATPGRMKDMIGRRMIDLSKIEYCVLDEADEMLNMGFFEDITDILSHSPEDKSTWLFIATMPKEVSSIPKKFMHTPVEITIGSRNIGAEKVSHEYYLVKARDRYMALKRLADANPSIFSVIFCRTKRETQKVAERLIEDGYNAAALHGDLSQNQRDLVMKSFRTRQIQMLVATDVAARGIDVEDITHVINYQLPDEIETYTHRSGRTGRAGKTGVSMVIVTKSDLRKIKAIEKKIQKQFDHKEIPSGMEICEIQLHHLANSIYETEINHEIDPYLPTISGIFEDLTKEELIKKMFSVEFSRFYNYYKKGEDINIEKTDTDDEHEDSVRYFMNVGAKDDFNWMRLKDFLKDLLQLEKDDIFKVDVMGSFSFFNTERKHQQLVMDTFHDFSLDGRRISVEISKDTGRNSKERIKRKEKKSSKRGKFESRTSNERPRFKGRERRRSGRQENRGTGGKRRIR